MSKEKSKENTGNEIDKGPIYGSSLCGNSAIAFRHHHYTTATFHGKESTAPPKKKKQRNSIFFTSTSVPRRFRSGTLRGRHREKENRSTHGSTKSNRSIQYVREWKSSALKTIHFDRNMED